MTLTEEGNEMSQTKAYFDAAIALQQGQKLLVPAQNYNHMESLRVQLIAERRRWRDSTTSTEDLTISRKQQDDKCFVLIEKIGAAPPAMILDENNEIISFVTVSKTIPGDEITLPDSHALPPTNEEERMRALMKEDGMSQEQIDDYFKGGGSDDEAGTDPEVA